MLIKTKDFVKDVDYKDFFYYYWIIFIVNNLIINQLLIIELSF